MRFPSVSGAEMEETALFSKYRETGDQAIRNQIVEKYLYIAAVLAKKFVGRGVEYDDLYQIASLALLRGVERFDETKGLKFSTFITPTITGEIKNYFRDRSRLIHLPRKVAELRGTIKREADKIFTETGKQPTAKQLSEVLGVSEEEIVRAMEAGNVVSLDKPMESDDDSGMSFHEVLSEGGGEMEQLENRDAVETALAGLSEVEREIVKYRYGEELSQSATARKMGVSQMYVSRMERKILAKLKKELAESV